MVSDSDQSNCPVNQNNNQCHYANGSLGSPIEDEFSSSSKKQDKAS
jgi:hypothetical protein